MNETISYSQLRKTLKASLDRVCEDRQPLLVERKNGDDVVIVSRDDYTSLEETAYLLQSPTNAKRLLQALERNPKDRIVFDSIETLKNEIDL